MTIDQVLEKIQVRLHLSKQTEHEVLEEIRTHLEDAVAEAVSKGEDEQAALMEAAQKFGIDEASDELQEIHSNHDSIDAVVATALPVLFAVIFRWLAFAPDGSARDWPQLFVRPAFWVVALASLALPFVIFRRWRYVLVGWGIFWVFTVIFVVFPSIHHW